jgi:hypothetical protein
MTVRSGYGSVSKSHPPILQIEDLDRTTVPSGNTMQVFAGHTGPVQCGEFTPDGEWIIPYRRLRQTPMARYYL